MQNKKQIFYWVLYDFANSIPVVVFFIYFSQWLTVEQNISPFWFNMIFAFSSVLLLITAPTFGAIADKKQARLSYLKITTLLQFLFIFLTAVFASFSNHISQAWLFAYISYTLAIYFYQFTFSFYNPLLKYIAPEESQGKISGFGQAANWLGQLFGIILAIYLAKKGLGYFGITGRTTPLIPSTLLFLFLSLPMLLLFKENALQTSQPIISFGREFKNYFFNLKKILILPGVGFFLLGFFFFNDAILTAQNNFPLYLQTVFHVTDQNKSILLLFILLTSVIGALLGGYAADKIGYKKSLNFILVLWIFIFPALGLQNNFNIFSGLTILMGILYGATWSITRTAMTKLVPKEATNQAFTYYTLAERFATFVGPVTWGLVASTNSSTSYKIAISSMTVFIIIGYFFIKKIPENNPPYAASGK